MKIPFIIGVNYWPTTFVRMWQDQYFDLATIKRDFENIINYGMNTARLFLTWPEFQPKLAEVNPEALHKLNQVLSLADEMGLQTIPTLLVGHMSGANWLPSWADSGLPNDRPQTYVFGGHPNRPQAPGYIQRSSHGRKRKYAFSPP